MFENALMNLIAALELSKQAKAEKGQISKEAAAVNSKAADVMAGYAK